MLSAMRSLIDPPGLARSSLQKAETEDGKRRLILTMGVRPIVLRMLSKGAMLLALSAADGGYSTHAPVLRV